MEEDSVGIARVFPEHHTCKLVFSDVGALESEGFGVVIGDKDMSGGVVEIRR
jgi:hypothetical protein